MYAVFASNEQGTETYDFINGSPEPKFRKIKDACVHLDRWNQRSGIDLRVTYSSNKDAGGRYPFNILTLHQWDAASIVMGPYYYWTSGFATEIS